MTRDQIEQWLQACAQHPELFDHERLVFKVMRECLPPEKEYSAPVDRLREPQTVMSNEPYIVAAGGRVLKGPEYHRFIQFWDAFDHKSVSSRAAAAKSWMQIKDPKTPEFMDHIVAAAKHEAKTRTDPAKHAQGWLTERRWEQYQPKDESALYTADWWRKHLGPVECKTGFRRERRETMKTGWNPQHGPNPWNTVNPKMPPEIRKEYAAWGWKEE